MWRFWLIRRGNLTQSTRATSRVAGWRPSGRRPRVMRLVIREVAEELVHEYPLANQYLIFLQSL